MAQKRKRVSPIEDELKKEFNDVEYTVVHLVNLHGQVEAARRLDVPQSWVSRFLARHGYKAKTIYQKAKEYTFMPPSMRRES